MVSSDVTIVNELGLDMVPAGILAKEMAAFTCDVDIVADGRKVNAKSVMNIIAGCIKKGDIVTIEADGVGEQDALDRAVWLIESGFDM